MKTALAGFLLEMASINSSNTSSFENVSASPNRGCFSFDSMAIKVSRVVAYCIVILVSVLGNSLIIYIVAKERRMRKTVNYFIVNMAAADLLITFYMPRAISQVYAGFEWQVEGTAGLIFCKLVVFFHETAIAVSNFTVVAISFDRFFAVVFPLKVFITERGCSAIIVLIWIVAIALRVPMVYGAKTIIRQGQLTCFLNLDEVLGKGAEKAYYQFTLIGLFSIPLITILILYSTIFIFIKSRKPPGEGLSRNQYHRRRAQATKKKVLRMVTVVVGAFVLCWLLYFIQLILFSYKITVSCDVLFLKLFLAHFNSALNPCLYVTFSENFRKCFKDILLRLPFCRYALETPVVTLAPTTVEDVQTTKAI